MGNLFSKGTFVEWTSQSHGVTTTKRGTILEFIPAGEPIKTNLKIIPTKILETVTLTPAWLLELGDWQKNYIQEKLTCIYQNDVFN